MSNIINPVVPTLPDTSGITSSENIAELATALAVAQGEFKPVGKNAVNPHFKSKYADLASIVDASREALSRNGLALIQAPAFVDGRVVVISRIIHKSGQWIESRISMKAGQDTPQAIGSVITYGRRYGLSAILGICADDDDDANAAQPTTPMRKVTV
jgi:hypothetical protein